MSQLDETIAWYRTVKANQLLVSKVLKDHIEVVPETSPFFGLSESEATRMLEESAAEVEDLTVVALVSFFEQLVIDSLRELVERIETEQTSPTMGALAGYAFRDVERWRFDDILKLFEAALQHGLLDQVRNIYRYRNWVAHGKRKQKPVITDPVTAYEALSRFLSSVGEVVRSSHP